MDVGYWRILERGPREIFLTMVLRVLGGWLIRTSRRADHQSPGTATCVFVADPKHKMKFRFEE